MYHARRDSTPRSRKNMSINEAMKYFYNSKTFKDLLNPETKLFIQSPVYIFDTLESQG